MNRALSAGRKIVLGLLLIAGAAGADGKSAGIDFDVLMNQARRVGQEALSRFERTPPVDRVIWGGLGVSALLGVWVVLERIGRLRARRIVPEEFTRRFLSRMRDGKLDRGKALDFCELNPSPAARVALAAVRRWGRPSVDLERSVALAQRAEAARLRRNVGTLRRIAALSPMLGLLGSLFALTRVLDAGATTWGPALAAALNPLTAGVALSIVALIAHDVLSGRVEALVGTLDRIGGETIDAVAMALPLPVPVSMPMPAPAQPEPQQPRPTMTAVVVPPGPVRAPHSAPPPHPYRMDVPYPSSRPIDDDDDDYN